MRFLVLWVLCIVSHAYPCFDIKGKAPTKWELELITNNINHFKDWNKVSIQKLMEMDFFNRPEKTDEATMLIKRMIGNCTNIGLWMRRDYEVDTFIDQVNKLYKTHRRQLPRKLVQDLKGLRIIMKYYVEHVILMDKTDN